MALSLAAKKIVWAASRRVEARRNAAEAARRKPARAAKKKRPTRATRKPAKAGALDEDGATFELDNLITFAQRYAGLGEAVQAQLDDIVDGFTSNDPTLWDDINPNAVTIIERRLSGYSDELDEAIAAYRSWEGGEDEDEFDSEEDDAEELRRMHRINFPRRRRN